MAATARDALLQLRRQPYGHVLIGMSKPFSRAWRLACIAWARQLQAKVVLLVDARDQPFVQDVSHDYVIKEYVFSTLLDLL